MDTLFLEELARVFDTEAKATALLAQAGVPRSRVHFSGNMTPDQYLRWL